MTPIPGSRRSRLTFLTVILLAVLLGACGGNDDGNGGSVDATDNAETSVPSEEPAEAGAELVVTGDPVHFRPAAGVELTVPVGADGSCEVPETSFDDQPDFVTLCAGHFSGTGGDFLVVVITREVDSHDVGIFCSSGGDDYRLVASIIGAGTPVTQQLDFAGIGEVAGMVLYDGFLSDASSADVVLVSQPQGSECPTFHGVGEVSTDVITPQGGLNGATTVGYAGPNGELATCTTVVDDGFVTTPARGGTCPGLD